MKLSTPILFFAGLVAGIAIPDAQTWQGTIMRYYNTEACHSVLTLCRVDVECCPGLRCKTVESESVCTPSG
ncbi:hypothetical protein OQA88_5780 [Cercophora sp. LCS_1]